ncbi:TVA4 protein, partial [Catharus fuscescens]|nr:TVA4 protein [Catharus fuscescens]
FSVAVAAGRAQVRQDPSLETTEGSGINISCSHPQIQTNEWIHWYRQLPGHSPELVALTAKAAKELPDNAGQLWVSADRRSSSLWLRRPRRGDAAVYYCAL